MMSVTADKLAYTWQLARFWQNRMRSGQKTVPLYKKGINIKNKYYEH